MMFPLFTQGQRVRLPALKKAVDTHGLVLVRTYTSVNVATTTASKYNRRYRAHGLEFHVRRSDGATDTPMAGAYGVYAYKIGT